MYILNSGPRNIKTMFNLALWEHGKSFENKILTFLELYTVLGRFESMIVLEAEITFKYLLYWKEVVVDKISK